jgi:CheY-like chemotaxis protein
MATVLLVEDDNILREVYVTILRAGGFNVDAAANGKIALELCAKATYDLILLDLMMPVLDGVGFLKQTNMKHTAPKTKVVLFSNLSSGSLIEEARALGVDDHVLKSNLTPKSLTALVRRYVAK